MQAKYFSALRTYYRANGSTILSCFLLGLMALFFLSFTREPVQPTVSKVFLYFHYIGAAAIILAALTLAYRLFFVLSLRQCSGRLGMFALESLVTFSVVRYFIGSWGDAIFLAASAHKDHWPEVAFALILACLFFFSTNAYSKTAKSNSAK